MEHNKRSPSKLRKEVAEGWCVKTKRIVFQLGASAFETYEVRRLTLRLGLLSNKPHSLSSYQIHYYKPISEQSRYFTRTSLLGVRNLVYSIYDIPVLI